MATDLPVLIKTASQVEETCTCLSDCDWSSCTCQDWRTIQERWQSEQTQQCLSGLPSIGGRLQMAI
jgi:hypothetical protein